MPSTFASGGSEDPLVSFSFMLEVNGVVAGYFTEVSGVGSETEVVEQKHTLGDGRVGIRKAAGLQKWTDITLKRGVTTNMDLWDWRQTVVDGDMAAARNNGTITLYTVDGDPVARWNFENGWPSAISGPNFKSDDNSFAMEEITIVHEGVWRES